MVVLVLGLHGQVCRAGHAGEARACSRLVVDLVEAELAPQSDQDVQIHPERARLVGDQLEVLDRAMEQLLQQLALDELGEDVVLVAGGQDKQVTPLAERTVSMLLR